jgi:heme-degrading monooxygenase HmoA
MVQGVRTTGGIMAELVTTGIWTVSATKEEAFIEAWTGFAAWASAMPGAGTLRLGRDTGNVLRFVSYGVWDSVDAVRAWKSAPEFRERIVQVLQYVEDFHPSELDVVATCTGGMSAVAHPILTGVK